MTMALKLSIATIVWLAMFSVLRYTDGDGIVFYQGISLSLILGLIIYFSQKSFHLAAFFVVFTYSINLTAITTVDRAYSVKLIEWMGNSTNPTTINEMEKMFQYNFIQTGAVRKRVVEQISSGIFVCEGEECQLTRFGKLIFECFSLTRKIFNL